MEKLRSGSRETSSVAMNSIGRTSNCTATTHRFTQPVPPPGIRIPASSPGMCALAISICTGATSARRITPNGPCPLPSPASVPNATPPARMMPDRYAKTPDRLSSSTGRQALGKRRWPEPCGIGCTLCTAYTALCCPSTSCCARPRAVMNRSSRALRGPACPSSKRSTRGSPQRRKPEHGPSSTMSSARIPSGSGICLGG